MAVLLEAGCRRSVQIPPTASMRPYLTLTVKQLRRSEGAASGLKLTPGAISPSYLETLDWCPASAASPACRVVARQCIKDPLRAFSDRNERERLLKKMLFRRPLTTVFFHITIVRDSHIWRKFEVEALAVVVVLG